MAIIARLFAIGAGYLLAVLAGTTTLAALFMQTGAGGEVAEWVSAITFVFAFSGFFGSFFLPFWIALVTLAEWLRWRSIIVYSGAAMLVSVIGGLSGSANLPTSDIIVLAAGGAVGGLVYWLLAGHRAGRWRDRLRTAAD